MADTGHPRRGYATLRHVVKEFSKAELDHLTQVFIVGREDIAYTHPIFLQCFLPVREKVTEYNIQHGQFGLSIEAGKLGIPGKPGEYQRCQVPYGAKARLMFAYINDRAIRTKSPQIELGVSMCDFMKRMGVKVGGRNEAELERQAYNIAAASIQVTTWQANEVRTTWGRVARSVHFWREPNTHQMSFWQREMVLHQDYFTALMEHRAPVDYRALVCLQDSPRAMDVYTWLSSRLYRLNPKAPLKLPWSALQPIFGGQGMEIYDFRKRFKDWLRKAVRYYPEARVAVENDFLVLRHSPSAVPSLNAGGAEHRPALIPRSRPPKRDSWALPSDEERTAVAAEARLSLAEAASGGAVNKS